MLKKRFLKARNMMKVTFYTAKTVKATEVCLVGDFNDWDETATPMKPLKDGRFTVALRLQPGSAYEFRYLVDGEDWHNEWEADHYVPNPHGSDNSVVTT